MLPQLINGNLDALRQLMDVYFPVLCRYAGRMLNDAALAEDVVQETFIKLWRHTGSFATLSALKGFLFTLTRNGCLNLLRGREREETRHRNAAAGAPLEVAPVLNDMIHAESIALIYKVVRTLPEHLQEVFFLSFEEGLSISEIADRLQIPIAAVSKRKYRTLVILRRRFGNKGLSFFSLLPFV